MNFEIFQNENGDLRRRKMEERRILKRFQSRKIGKINVEFQKPGDARNGTFKEQSFMRIRKLTKFAKDRRRFLTS